MRRFAQKLAEHGFVTIAADAAYQGASGGTPRQTDRPANRVEDIRAMVDFISTYPGVDAQRVGALGICGAVVTPSRRSRPTSGSRR